MNLGEPLLHRVMISCQRHNIEDQQTIQFTTTQMEQAETHI